MGPLIGAALGLAPELLRLLGLGQASGLAKAAAEAIVGTSDPAEIKNLPPDKQAELRAELARIALAERQAELADVADARALSEKSNLIAWAQVCGAAGVLLLYAAILLIFAFRGVPADGSGIFTLALGVLTTLLPIIAGFFYGNATAANSANARMDQIAARATPLLTLPGAASEADRLNAQQLQEVRR
ncbi:hypothetical protein [Teichococcus oryzae]|uniref:Uncharacterized protein n=1 Tax=Teichococcus oryzae TaxID=1608942 RepID=A0A5B2TB54_9PROT|nr:hypothetical protein [Pseudoroseomonas oryzae]KAA2211315.1 hypothetical protein F0Q34_20715 [Pseudoroseomonas oryzae]